MENVVKMKTRADDWRNVHGQLACQIKDEENYWKNVLNRIVAVIQALSSRGLSFRGQNQIFGSQHNVNYLMMIETIANFINRT